MESLLCIVVVVLLLYFFYVYSQSEHLTQPVFYDDMMAMKYPDPIWLHYAGDERDVDGMSSRDYYLENNTLAGNWAAPFYFEGAAGWRDHTDYLNMPSEYRPRGLSHFNPNLNRELAADAEDNVLSKINRDGHY